MYLKSIYFLKNATEYSLSDLCKLNKISSEMQRYYEKWMGLGYVKRYPAQTHETLVKSLLIDFMFKKKVICNKMTFCFYVHTADDVFPYSHSLLNSLKNIACLKDIHFIGHTLQKCASVFQVFIIIKKLMERNALCTDILIIIADLTFTPVFESITGSTILSDGALLLHVSKEGEDNQLIDTMIFEEPAYYRGVFASQSIYKEFEYTYVDKVVKSINTILVKNKLTINNIKKIYPHNVNTRSWIEIAKKLVISLEKVYLENVYFHGHRFGCDSFINLYDSVLKNELQKNDFYLLVSVGLGASYGVSLCRY